MNKTKTPVIISKSKADFNLIFDILLPIGLLGFVLYLFLFKEFEITRIYSVAILGLIALTIYRLFKRFGNQKQIIIDSIGIKLFEENKIFIWKEIQFAFFENNTLHIITNRQKTEKSMEGLKFSLEDVENAIINFSGREIANYSENFDSEIESILKKNKSPDEIIKTIKKINNYQSIIATTILFGIIGISIFLQVKTILNYAIGFGFIIVITLLWKLNNIVYDKLKSNLAIYHLKDKQIKELALKYKLIANKKELTAVAILWGFITIAAFVLTFVGLNRELFD